MLLSPGVAIADGSTFTELVLLVAPASVLPLATVTGVFSPTAAEEAQICKVPQVSSRSASSPTRRSSHPKVEVCHLWYLCQGVVEDHAFTARVVSTGPCEDHWQAQG